MPEVIDNHRIDIRQFQRGGLEQDLLGSAAVVERTKDCLQPDTRPPDTEDSILIRLDWRRLRDQHIQESHRLLLSGSATAATVSPRRAGGNRPVDPGYGGPGIP